jgi:penicillin-binding protein 1A
LPPRKAPPQKRPAPKRRPVRKKPYSHNHIIIFLLSVCGLCTLLIGTGLAWFLSLDIPDIRSFNDYQPQVATTLLDRRDRVIDLIGEEHRIVIGYEQMGKYTAKAFVAAEDSRYWQHPGLDAWSILRAFINNLRSGRKAQGGSTITQQVTRSLMLSREKTYFRKITEAVLSYRLDRMLTKEEILAIYLNEIYLGEGVYGVEAAALSYFGKRIKQCSLAEAALLAGLPQAPSRYSPRKNFQAAKARQRYVLNRMAEDAVITSEAARRAYKESLHLQNIEHRLPQNGWFADYVRRQLEQEYGEKPLYRKGLVVKTTLDSRMQVAALSAVQKGVALVAARKKIKDKPQAALVALGTGGEVRAMVGGSDYALSPFNRVVAARRQPGSVFKPLIYAVALEQGMTASTQLDDSPFSITNRNKTVWKPQNFTGRFHGPTSLHDSLVYSRNIPTIRLLQKVGLQPVLEFAGKVGVNSELRPELTLALGASPVTLLEMTGAYSVFQQSGSYFPPVVILNVRGQRGGEKNWPEPKRRQVLSTKSAQQMRSILRDVIRQGTGKKASGVHGAAGKTGTSDENRDAWFIGFNDRLLCGVWLGYDKKRGLGKGETGGRTAAPVWKEFMQAVGQ